MNHTGQLSEDDFKVQGYIRTYAVIAHLLTKQSFSTIFSSQNALIAEQCVSYTLRDYYSCG